ncbi:MAG: DinB family protein [Vicinamibacteraceae bacterium]
MPVPEYAPRLRDAIAHATPLLLALDADASATPAAPGKWSAREIVGHLIDSAANNHQRFVRGQLQDDLVFLGYAQEDWVRVQHYADAPWEELVALWRLYNLHLARVMEHTPADRRLSPRAHHNVQEIGFAAPIEATATLDGIMLDYVEHLVHHLRQLGVASA